MKIVTGRRGEDHISSNDFQAFNQGVLGGGNYVLNIGSKFAPTLTSPTELRIADGEGVMQGVHFRISPGLLDTVELSPGIMGVNRIDIVCARYEKDDTTGIENVSWYVVEGTPSSGIPVAPDVVTGDIVGGDTLADFPIFKVQFTGLEPVVSKTFIHAIGESIEAEFVLNVSTTTPSSKQYYVDEGMYLVELGVGSSGNRQFVASVDITHYNNTLRRAYYGQTAGVRINQIMYIGGTDVQPSVYISAWSGDTITSVDGFIRLTRIR